MGNMAHFWPTALGKWLWKRNNKNRNKLVRPVPRTLIWGYSGEHLNKPIKVIGKRREGWKEGYVKITLAHCAATSIPVKGSEGNYLSIWHMLNITPLFAWLTVAAYSTFARLVKAGCLSSSDVAYAHSLPMHAELYGEHQILCCSKCIPCPYLVPAAILV